MHGGAAGPFFDALAKIDNRNGRSPKIEKAYDVVRPHIAASWNILNVNFGKNFNDGFARKRKTVAAAIE